MRARDIAARVKEQEFTTTAKTGLNIAVSSQLAHGFKAGKFDRVGPGVYVIKPEPSQRLKPEGVPDEK